MLAKGVSELKLKFIFEFVAIVAMGQLGISFAFGQAATAPKPLLAEDVFKNVPNHVIFVRAEKDLDFQYVAEVIDLAKGAGLERVALMPR